MGGISAKGTFFHPFGWWFWENSLPLQQKLISMKTILLLLTLVLTCYDKAEAYNDHRVQNLDSVELRVTKHQTANDEDLMGCYKILMRGYLVKDGRKHEHYCREAIALSYRHNWKNARAAAVYQLGVQHYGQEKWEESERYFRWALALNDSMRREGQYKESDIDDNCSQLYGAMGNLFNIQDKLLLAIEYYQKALPIFEKYGWLESQTILHHNVAELWLSMGNNEKAKAEYLKAIETGEASKDSLMMALPRKGLTKIYIDEDDYEKVRQTLLPAYNYYHAHRQEEASDYLEILAALVKMNLMSGHEDLTKAKAFAKEALAYVNEELMSETRCDVYAAAAMVAMREKNWQQALQYALQSVHDDEEATYGDVGCYELIAQIYMELGDKQKAREYMKKLRKMMERYATENYQSALSQMEVIYETEQKEKTIEQLTRQKQWYLWGGILLIGLLLAMASVFFLLWRSVRLKRKSALFKAKLEGEVAERSRIARDLHDGLGGMLSLLRLKLDGNAPRTEALQLLNQSATELRHIAHNLMPEQLLQGGLVTALRDFAASIPEARFQTFGKTEGLSKDVEIVLYRCAYELVHNALKHANADRIDIQLMRQQKQVTLSVSDNGKGIDKHASDSDGVGLQNILERIGNFKGQLTIVDNKGKGTDVNVSLPL